MFFMLFGRFLIIEGGWLLFYILLNCCLGFYMVYRWLFSDPMLCLESLQLFYFISLASMVICKLLCLEIFSHFF